MTASHKGLFSAMLHTIYQRAKNPNWQEGWLEGNIHQHDRRAKDSNSEPPGYESAL